MNLSGLEGEVCVLHFKAFYGMNDLRGGRDWND